MRTPKPQAAALIGLAMITLSGCGLLDTPAAPTPQPGDSTQAVIVSGSHANVPAPRLTGGMTDRIRTTLTVGGNVAMVQVAGTPSYIASDDLNLRPVKGTPAGQASLVKSNMHKIEAAMAQSPTGPGSNTWESLAQAGGAVSDGQNPVIYFVDSGLSDSGLLNFTEPGMLGASPTDVVRHLRGLDALLKLDGVTVYLSGIGYSTPPQEPLNTVQRANVVAIYQAALEASGARVIVDTTPVSGDPVDSNGMAVRPVELPAPAPAPAECVPTELVFDSQSAVSFLPDEAQFVDPGAAAAALDPVAEWLLANPARTAMIRGTTADEGPLNGQQALGLARAEAVKADLVQRGVLAAQVGTAGVGSDFPEYIRPDRDASGNLLPGPAAVNRSVRIVTTGTC